MLRRLLPALAATVLVACGGGSDTGTADGSADESTPAPAATTPATPATSGTTAPGSDVPAALQLTAPLVGGGEIELGAYAGRPVLLWFWAPW